MVQVNFKKIVSQALSAIASYPAPQFHGILKVIITHSLQTFIIIVQQTVQSECTINNVTLIIFGASSRTDPEYCIAQIHTATVHAVISKCYKALFGTAETKLSTVISIQLNQLHR